MGFKINYHSEIVIFLSTMFILTVPMQLQANANIPEQTIPIDAIGQILEEQQSNEFLSAPLPQLNIPQESIPLINTKELHCLTEAIYFESKNESLKGQKAVAHVIVNRTKNSKFPTTVCKVINEKHNSTCQFSYKCEGKKPLKNKEDLEVAADVARSVLEGENDITQGALYFHNNTVKPAWAKASKLTMVIGNHRFYRG